MTVSRFNAGCLLALLAAVLVAGCGGSSGGTGGSAASGGAGVSTLRIAAGNGDYIESLNPLDTSCFVCQAAFRMMYPYLVQYNTDGSKVEGDFASSYTHNPKATEWTFKVRSGAKWSDGQPLTASDAAWTLSTLLKYEETAGAAYSTSIAGITKVTAPNPTTVVVQYAKPTYTAPVNLTQVPILPEHIWSKYATGDGTALTTFSNEEPVTGGPFELAKEANHQYALFAANPGWYGPKPTVEGFGFQFFTNEDAVVNAVLSHEVDAAVDVTTSALNQLNANPQVKIETAPGMDTMLLEINSSKYQEKNHELQNPKVREAIDLAINRENLVDVVQNGKGTVTGSLLPPALKEWSDPSLAEPEFNPAKANKILDEAGFAKGSNGVRVAEGHEMSYQFPYPAGDDPRLIQILVNNLGAIGIKLNAFSQDISSWIEGVQGNKYAKFDMTVNDFGPSYDPSQQMSMPTCSQWGGLSMSGYCNAEYDRLFEKQLTQPEAARHKTVDQLQQMIAEQRPIIPLFARDTVTARWDDVNVPLSGPLIVNYETKDWLLSEPVSANG